MPGGKEPNIRPKTTRAAGKPAVVRGKTVCGAIPHTVLEGHRIATEKVAKGESLLSWGRPFGIASRDLEPGDYVCNDKVRDRPCGVRREGG